MPLPTALSVYTTVALIGIFLKKFTASLKTYFDRDLHNLSEAELGYSVKKIVENELYKKFLSAHPPN